MFFLGGGQGRQASEVQRLLSRVARVVKQTRYAIYCREWHGLFDVFRWKPWALRWNMVASRLTSLRLVASKHRAKLGAFAGISVK